jgi:hypothetical protein
MMTVLDTLISELEQDGLLDQADRLRQRLDALDRLETYLLHGRHQTDDIDSIDRPQLHDRARAISAKLEAANGKLYEAIRCEIQQGVRPHGLLKHVRESGGDARAVRRSSGEGYDYLDALISGVLQFEEPNAGVEELEPEMVCYQPTPARHIFDLIGRTALTERDVLIDLGSGLGHVPLLTSICTSTRSIGIERETAYVDCARQSSRDLNLANVTFIRQDVRAADLSCGTLFYLYTPFTGAILRDVLDALRRESSSRRIRLCTYGPCTPIIAEERWLENTGALQADRIAIFRTRN